MWVTHSTPSDQPSNFKKNNNDDFCFDCSCFTGAAWTELASDWNHTAIKKTISEHNL
jgi:hypothetical protein